MYRNSVNCLKIKNEFTTFAVAFRITVIWIKQKYAYFKFIHYTNCKNYSEVASFLYGITSLVAICIYWNKILQNSNAIA